MKSIIVGPWKIAVDENEIFLPQWAVEVALKIIARWVAVFPKENTWVNNQYGVPSLIIRLDCIVKDGELVIYEVEDRPAGVGVSILANPVFTERLKFLQALWPEFEAVISPQRDGSDDGVWLSTIAKEEVNGSLVLIRAEPEETDFHYLQSKSISTLMTEGNKEYGVNLGLWSEVAHQDQLPWEKSFVLKPLQGSKCKNVEIWNPNKKGSGISTKSRVSRILKEQGKMYMQPFSEPMDCPSLPEFFMIYRFCFGFDPNEKRYIPLGGLWAARPSQKIHGAGDTVFGPLNF